MLARLLDAAGIPARYALIKLVTGGLRIGVSARLAKQALANLGGVDAAEIEEIWHGLEPPYASLFAWLEGRAPRPRHTARALFRSVMLSHPVEDQDLQRLDPDDYAAEWKWDGIRVQAVAEEGLRKLYSRTGDEISGAFPDLVEAMGFDGALDGELLVGRPPEHTGSFSDLQQRLNRRNVSAKMRERFPVFMRCYDLLQDGSEDLRALPFTERRPRLEAFVSNLDPARFDLSPLTAFADWTALDAMRQHPPHPVIEGVMIKQKASPYIAGRPKGPWYKWKRDPYTVDAVLMYAQRGHGKRSSFYSDFTFGVWTGGEGEEELVPVGKAYFGFTDEECANSTNMFATTRWSGSGRFARCVPTGAPDWCWKSPSKGSTARHGTARASPCASRVYRACAGTSRRPRRIVSSPCRPFSVSRAPAVRAGLRTRVNEERVPLSVLLRKPPLPCGGEDRRQAVRPRVSSPLRSFLRSGGEVAAKRPERGLNRGPVNPDSEPWPSGRDLDFVDIHRPALIGEVGNDGDRAAGARLFGRQVQFEQEVGLFIAQRIALAPAVAQFAEIAVDRHLGLLALGAAGDDVEGRLLAGKLFQHALADVENDRRA